MQDILQTSLPYDPLSPRPLPGIAPLRMQDWLLRDEAFAGQMRRRADLLQRSRSEVLALSEGARDAAVELLELVLAQVYPGCVSSVLRADGVRVEVNRDDPMGTLGLLVQEDLCILQKQGDEHVLTGAVLCFPASWTLSEKFMRPLTGIHEPVGDYDAGIARRVQRLFDGVHPDRPLWRFNALWYADPELHQPRSIHERRSVPETSVAEYLRSERQCILRLPRTLAVIFSIHTYVLQRTAVPQKVSAPR